MIGKQRFGGQQIEAADHEIAAKVCRIHKGATDEGCHDGKMLGLDQGDLAVAAAGARALRRAGAITLQAPTRFGVDCLNQLGKNAARRSHEHSLNSPGSRELAGQAAQVIHRGIVE